MLHASKFEPGVPGEAWLEAGPTCTWAVATGAAVSTGQRLDPDAWSDPSSGVVLVHIHRELDGPLLGAGKRLRALLGQAAPEFAQRLAHDQVRSLEYSDRYLKSPWSVMLLSEFVRALVSHSSPDLVLTVQEAGPSPRGGASLRVSHDWQRPEIQRTLCNGSLITAGCGMVKFHSMAPSQDMMHSRVLAVHWVSGGSTLLYFDYGMGYWKAREGTGSFARRAGI